MGWWGRSRVTCEQQESALGGFDEVDGAGRLRQRQHDSCA